MSNEKDKREMKPSRIYIIMGWSNWEYNGAYKLFKAFKNKKHAEYSLKKIEERNDEKKEPYLDSFWIEEVTLNE